MDKVKTVIIIVIVLIVGAGAYFALASSDDNNNTNNTDNAATGNNGSETPNDADTNTETDNTQPAETAGSVAIQNYAFSPATITVKKGATVTWTNQDTVEHSIVPDDPTEAFKESEVLGQGDTYSVTFNETGSFTYHCGMHSYMTGTVEVVE